MIQEKDSIIVAMRQKIYATPESELKEDMCLMIEDFLDFILTENPKLLDKSITSKEKMIMFFKLIGKLALDGGISLTMGSLAPDTSKKFNEKLDRCKNLFLVFSKYYQK